METENYNFENTASEFIDDVKISRIAGTSLELIHYNEIGNDKRDSLKSYKIG